MRRASSEFLTRIKVFDGLVESAAALADKLDIAAFEPQAQPLVQQLPNMVKGLFLPNIDSSGSVQVPPSQLESDNYMLLPLLSDTDRPIMGSSLYRVTPGRLALMAQRSGLSDAVLRKVCDDFTYEAGTFLAGRRVQHDAEAAVATTWTGRFYTATNGRPVQLSTRPLIAVSSENADDVTVLHEGVHGIMAEASWRSTKPDDAELDALLTHGELVAYHVGAVASSFRTTLRPYSTVGTCQSEIEIEAYRRAHAPTNDPFRVTAQTVQDMANLGAI